MNSQVRSEVNPKGERKNPLTFDDMITLGNHISEIKRAKSLSPLEIACLQAGWEKENYSDFCNRDEISFTFSSLRSASSRLYQMLAEYFDVTSIHKTKLYDFIQDLHQNGTLKEYFQQESSTERTSSLENLLKEQNILFIGRTQELNHFQELLEKNCVISVWGASGIGKTAFIRAYSKIKSKKFSFVIFTDISYISTLEDLASDILCQARKGKSKNKVESLFEFLIRDRCLIILDNCESLNVEVSNFLNRISLARSKSKFVLISRTKQDLSVLHNSASFQLMGLKEYELLFQELELTGSQSWGEFNYKYSGNIGEILRITKIIKDYFEGDVHHYINTISTIISQSLINEFRQIEFTEIDFAILAELIKNKGLTLGDVLSRLNKIYSTSDIIERLKFLENNSHIVREPNLNLVAISTMLKKFLIKERFAVSE